MRDELGDYLRLPILDQCRLAYAQVGDASGSEAAELRRQFAARVSSAMAQRRALVPGTPDYSRAYNLPAGKRGSISISTQAVIYRVSAWRYMLEAGVEPTEHITQAAMALANSTVANKAKFVAKAIADIRGGADAEQAFLDAADEIREAAKRR